MTAIGSFGFTVHQCGDPDDPEFIAARQRYADSGYTGACPVAPRVDRWIVSLPHQCDEWQITNDWHGEHHDVAVAALEAFIVEAQSALVALRERREMTP